MTTEIDYVDEEREANEVNEQGGLHLPVYPTEQVPKLFSDYADMIATMTDAPRELVIASAITAFSAMVGSSFEINNTKLNLFTVLVGRTSVTHKTTVAKHAQKLARSYSEAILPGGDGISILNNFTVEGVESELAGRISKVFLCPGEYRSVFAVAKRQSQQNTVPMLTSLYDCEPHSFRLRNEKGELKDPYVCLLACSTRAWIDGLISAENIGGGFLNRHLIVWSRPSATPLLRTQNVPSVRYIDFVKPYLELTRSTQPLVGPLNDPKQLTFSPTASELWDSYYTAWHRYQSEVNEKQGEASGRETTIAIKLAGLFALADLRLELEKADVANGIAWAKASSAATHALAFQSQPISNKNIRKSLEERFCNWVEREYIATKMPVSKTRASNQWGGGNKNVRTEGAMIGLSIGRIKFVDGGYVPCWAVNPDSERGKK